MYQHTPFYLWIILYFKRSVFSAGEDVIADVPRCGLAGAEPKDEVCCLGRRGGSRDTFYSKNEMENKIERRRQDVHMGSFPFPAAITSGTSRNPSKFQSAHDKHFDSQM